MEFKEKLTNLDVDLFEDTIQKKAEVNVQLRKLQNQNSSAKQLSVTMYANKKGASRPAQPFPAIPT